MRRLTPVLTIFTILLLGCSKDIPMGQKFKGSYVTLQKYRIAWIETNFVLTVEEDMSFLLFSPEYMTDINWRGTVLYPDTVSRISDCNFINMVPDMFSTPSLEYVDLPYESDHVQSVRIRYDGTDMELVYKTDTELEAMNY